jgi:hypothetical protein
VGTNVPRRIGRAITQIAATGRSSATRTRSTEKPPKRTLSVSRFARSRDLFRAKWRASQKRWKQLSFARCLRTTPNAASGSNQNGATLKGKDLVEASAAKVDILQRHRFVRQRPCTPGAVATT